MGHSGSGAQVSFGDDDVLMIHSSVDILKKPLHCTLKWENSIVCEVYLSKAIKKTTGCQYSENRKRPLSNDGEGGLRYTGGEEPRY